MRNHGKRLREDVKQLVQPRARLVRQSMCSWAFMFSAIKTCGLVLFYYCFSVSLTFYNQRFIHMFKFPLSITMVHLVMKFVMSSCVRWILYCRTHEKRITLSWGEYFKRVGPPGLTSSLDIGLSNWGFEYVTVTLYTMTKSTVPIFILGFSILFKLEKPRISLAVVVLFIVVGLLMFMYQSTMFHLTGFLLILLASFLSGLRWTLSQLVLQKAELGLGHPIDMMYHIQPLMILALLPLSIGFEGLYVATSEHTFGFTDSRLLCWHLLILGLGAVLAFMLELSEYILLRNTSSLTLSLSGIFKEILVLVLAAVINGDRMKPINGIGLIICLLGICIHVVYRAIMARAEDKTEGKPLDPAIELLLRNGDAHAAEEEDDEEDVFNVRRDWPR